MMRKIACLLVICLLLSGCSLAQGQNLQEEQIPEQDQLIGVFLTREYLSLFDVDSYVKDNWESLTDGKQEDMSAYEGRVYAKRVEENGSADFIFEGYEGIRLFSVEITDVHGTYTAVISDPFFTDGASHFHSRDEGETVTLSATLHCAAREDGQEDYYVFHFNPVYQDSEGNVYMMAGTGISSGVGTFSKTIKGEVTRTENGVTTKNTTAVEVSISIIPEPGKTVVLFMDEDSGILSRQEFAPGAMPKELETPEGTAYLILEKYNAEGIEREICGPEADGFATFKVLDNGICQPVHTKILWK